MIRVFTTAMVDALPYLPLLYPNLGQQRRGSSLFYEEVFNVLKEPAVEIAADHTKAEFILIPHNYFHLKRAGMLRNYMEKARQLAKETPIILFAYGDSDEDIYYPNTIVFRYSQYRYKQKKYEVIMPPYAADLGRGNILPRRKGRVPAIGFCGWADYETAARRLKAGVKHMGIELQALWGDSRIRARKKGIYFRQKAIQAALRSPGIQTNFIIRTFHSHHAATIRMSEAEARREFIQNILDSDLGLAVKGDGNASVRFYEILSLGRVPLRVDTESLYPFEDRLQYRSFSLPISYQDLDRIGEAVLEFWSNTSEEQFLEMQKQARVAFERYFRPDAFFREALTSDYLLQHLR